MKLFQWKREDGAKQLGLVQDGQHLDLSAIAHDVHQPVPNTIDELISLGEEGLQSIKSALREIAGREPHYLLEEAEIQYLPAVNQPEKIICVGLNYLPHIQESKMEIPGFPVLFSKFGNALAAHREPIKLLPAAEQVDYEAELVIIIGKEARNLSPAEALDYVYGYTIGNDLSARDLQMRTSQWLLGKSPDQFAPTGPYLVTSADISPSELDISCTVNGSVRQASNTRNMIFNCEYLISYISSHLTLKPGDLIFTGTPEGVMLGVPEEDQEWLKPGDEVEVRIEGLGVLKNTFI
ncbi:fumarylacetoacetate hydrolase family protein [Paenibacillus pinistramenti]|uniref:fumarylacetoacetate hydrolase family protein n=1 Tax=Paenibacillus pinistramenti TaxID=1768003 RepID=UPI001109F833|nr:fumarylacetoacetate hydrolase family protein [Paenibacillus pinistramenti]